MIKGGTIPRVPPFSHIFPMIFWKKNIRDVDFSTDCNPKNLFGQWLNFKTFLGLHMFSRETSISGSEMAKWEKTMLFHIPHAITMSWKYDFGIQTPPKHNIFIVSMVSWMPILYFGTICFVSPKWTFCNYQNDVDFTSNFGPVYWSPIFHWLIKKWYQFQLAKKVRN